MSPVSTPEHPGLDSGALLRPFGRRHLATLVLALAVGSLGAINTWDLPTYLGVILCVLLLRGWLEDGRFHVVDAVARFGASPFSRSCSTCRSIRSYQALASGVGLVRSRTPVGYFLAIFGFFLFCIVSYIVVDVMAQRRSTLVRLVRLFTRRLDDAPVVAHRLRRLVHPSDRFRTAATAVLLVVVLVLLLVLLKQAIIALLLPLMLAGRRSWLPWRAEARAGVHLAVGLRRPTCSLGIEIFFLRDWLQGGSSYRMNTLFKFGIQVWIILGAGLSGRTGSCGRARPLGRCEGWPAGGTRVVRRVWPSCWWSCSCSRCSVLRRVSMTVSPANDQTMGTLDGTAFMTVGKYSFDWQGKNIPGRPEL